MLAPFCRSARGGEMALLNVLITVPRPLRDTILTCAAYEKLCSFARVTMNEDGRNWTGPEIAARLPGVDAMVTGWGGSCP